MEEGVALGKHAADVFPGGTALVTDPVLEAGVPGLRQACIRVVEDAIPVIDGEAQAEVDIEAGIARLGGESSDLIKDFAADGEAGSGHSRPVAAPAGTAEHAINVF